MNKVLIHERSTVYGCSFEWTEIGEMAISMLDRARVWKNTINEIFIYDAVKLFEPFRYFFFIGGFVLSIIALVYKAELSSYSGYLPSSINSGGIGACRFLVDAYIPLVAIYMLCVVAKLSKERIQQANLAVKRNKFAKKPVILASILLLLVPYIFFISHSPAMSSFFNLNKYGNLIISIPLFSYSTVQAFTIVACSLLARRFEVYEEQ